MIVKNTLKLQIKTNCENDFTLLGMYFNNFFGVVGFAINKLFLSVSDNHILRKSYK